MPKPPSQLVKARRQVLSDWRRIDITPLEQANRSTARSAGLIITGVLDYLKLDEKRAQAEILRVWNHQLNPTIVKHAHPVGIRKGTLFVAVDTSVWLDEIVRWHRKEILTRLQHSFGKDLITRIHFRLG